ncbi:TIGR03086 family metal-binding protein [Mobilicoccus massiliensis]|uniref:TIGR03086 family metal-binding protein n=1 Tax=Mobilicoccus massiliensis TaxID=1522310 RepID=UPI0005903D8D|nr:TIGR03086 family metal-binding protein [Mobilicoccus massiliensis]
MTETTLLFADGLDLVSAQVDSTDAEAWQNPSPCAGWRAVDVLAHVTGTVHKALNSLGGGDYASSPAEAAGEVDTTEVLARWRDTAGRAADAIVTADLDRVVPSPRGDVPLREALALPTADLAVHAWDLAASAGQDLELPSELRELVERLVRGMPEEILRSDQTFGPAVEPPAGANETARLMAFLGRRRP